MSVQKKSVTKFCSFYVSDWHMVTMLLPYVNKEINEQTKIVTFLEKDIQKNIETLVQKLNLKNKDKVLKLNWTSTNANKYTNVSKSIEKCKEENLLIIVNGSKTYIDKANQNIEHYLQKNQKQIENMHKTIKIVNCYEVLEFNGSIEEILNAHDKILNTSGEKEITEVFEGFERKEERIS